MEKNNIKKEVLGFIKEIIISAVIIFVLVNFVVRSVQVEGSSMYPTLVDNEIGVTNVIGRKFGQIKRFDIVVIYIQDKNEYIVKRVIGLPNETISYRNGQLYVNDQKVEESFLDTEYVKNYQGQFMNDISPIQLGDGQYYCLGDNRPVSRDSRYYGPFNESQIISKGVLVLFPFERFGLKTW